MTEYRTETDSMGEIKVPASARYGAQTQRAINNFSISGRGLPTSFIAAVALIKKTAAQVNRELGLLDDNIAQAIVQASEAIMDGQYDDQFPVDIFQTGSGTSTNMNVNEVIANLASEQLQKPVNPNDHVNMSKSSNDVIPTAIHVSAVMQLEEKLLPALEHLHTSLLGKSVQVEGFVKTGRTHLMDAMPVTLSQELEAWTHQIEANYVRLPATSHLTENCPTDRQWQWWCRCPSPVPPPWRRLQESPDLPCRA